MHKLNPILIMIIVGFFGLIGLFIFPTLYAQSSTPDLPMTVVNETESKDTNSNQSTSENTTTTKPISLLTQ